jgi:hypothetical protein
MKQDDRVISWPRGKKRPISRTLTKTVKAFFGNSIPRIESDVDRLYIASSKQHWIEVVMDVGTVNVITRNVDALTFTTANNLAAKISRVHKGEYTQIAEPRMVREARVSRVEKYLDDADSFYDDPDYD